MATEPTVTYAIEAVDRGEWTAVHVERIVAFPERWVGQQIVSVAGLSRDSAIFAAVTLVRAMRKAGRLRHA